jgi:hypothetical protein
MIRCTFTAVTVAPGEVREGLSSVMNERVSPVKTDAFEPVYGGLSL